MRSSAPLMPKSVRWKKAKDHWRYAWLGKYRCCCCHQLCNANLQYWWLKRRLALRFVTPLFHANSQTVAKKSPVIDCQRYGVFDGLVTHVDWLASNESRFVQHDVKLLQSYWFYLFAQLNVKFFSLFIAPGHIHFLLFQSKYCRNLSRCASKHALLLKSWEGG